MTSKINDVPIDFGDGRDEDQLASEQGLTRSPWMRKLAELAQGVADGKGEYDTYYRVGVFPDANGARTCARNLERREDFEVLGDMYLQSRIVVGAKGKKSSELWAALGEDA